MMLCALRPKADTYEGRKPMDSWIRLPGRPRNVWLNKVQQDANALLLSTMWRPEMARGHGASGATVHSDNATTMTTTTMMMMITTPFEKELFRRRVLRELSCLHYLLPDKRDSTITDRLRHAKTFTSFPIRTEKFRKSFISYCLNLYD